MPNNDNNDTFIKKYGINFTEQEYVVNPAIGREEELKRLSLVLLTPDKSAILTGKPGIGKTAIVEGLAYLIQRDAVPDALKGYTIIKVDTQALLGTVKETGDSRVQTLIDEILAHEKYMLFIDEIHTLVNATNESALDFAQMFKTGLGRGDLKVIGATTSDEYEKYILRDKAFTRRFQRIDVAEPDKEMTIKIVTGVIPRIEHSTGIKMGYSPFLQKKLATFVVELTTEYNRVYENAARYPDVAITMFSQAFSEALFANKKEVSANDVRNAILNSKAIYPDVIKKYIPMFDDEFSDLLEDENRDHSGLKETEVHINEALLNNEPEPVNGAENDMSDASVPSNEEINLQPNNIETKNTPSVEAPKVDTIPRDMPQSINKPMSMEVPKPEVENADQPIDDTPDVVDSMAELNAIYDKITNPFDKLRDDQ